MDEDIIQLELPKERDILGLVYQCLLTEGEKNILGSYYTPKYIVESLIQNINLDNTKTFLDPCCGSGSFFLEIEVHSPNQIYGFDCDPIAAMIAKVNLLCRFKEESFIPNVYCINYLESDSIFANNFIAQLQFDYIVTNPPWGALEKTGSDSFSDFMLTSYARLKENGEMDFLLPESILKIKAHEKIRKTLLTKMHLDSIIYLDGLFTGVMTKYICIKIQKAKVSENFKIEKSGNVSVQNVNDTLQRKDVVLSYINNLDNNIISAIQAKKRYDLSQSIFALGIVTGNNQQLLHVIKQKNDESIFTGKEIEKYCLKRNRYYIEYNRNIFQQVAKDEIYRADEKLIYKFISERLVFAYDNTKSLFLNSANIVIPNIPGYSIKSVLAFLNSEILQYFYQTYFNDIKILKSNLMELPFPEISMEQNILITERVNDILYGKTNSDILLQNLIYDCYGMDINQKQYIRGCLNG